MTLVIIYIAATLYYEQPPSVKHKCNYNETQGDLTVLFKKQPLSEVGDILGGRILIIHIIASSQTYIYIKP